MYLIDFHLTRGVSKASKVVNLSEDIFAGFKSTLREDSVTHHEYIQVCKGRDVGLNQIAMFEAKIANGNGEQTMSRDIYRLGHRFDFFRMLSCYFTTVGFYVSTMLTVLIVSVFLYGRLYLVLSGLEKGLSTQAAIRDNKSLQAALVSQSFVQIGFLMALPMMMEIGLERGFRNALSDFILMQLQLAPVFFTFTLGTKTRYYGRTLLHRGAEYRGTGRGFVVFHAKFSNNYRGLSGRRLLMIGRTGISGLATVEVSVFPADKSWESWWEKEQDHLRHSGKVASIAEIVSTAILHLSVWACVSHEYHETYQECFGLWRLMDCHCIYMLVVKAVSVRRRRFSASFQLAFRLIKGLIFIAFVSILITLLALPLVSVKDIVVCILTFLPTGCGILLIAQACKPSVKRAGFWGSVRTLACGYEVMMGMLLFTPVAFLAWFPFVAEFQTRMLFDQAFSRGLQISRILGGQRKDRPSNKQ